MRIVLSGPDGTGKSTIVNGLSEELKTRAPTHITWRRFGLLFSRSQNALGRLVGWSYYEKTPLGQIGYHRYRGIWAISYIVLVWVDCKLVIGPKWWLRDRAWRNDINIVDRFYIDIVADLILSTARPRTVLCFFDRILKAHVREDCCFILTCCPDVVAGRRTDIRYDRDYQRKVRIYDLLRRVYGVESLPTDKFDTRQCIVRIVERCG